MLVLFYTITHYHWFLLVAAKDTEVEKKISFSSFMKFKIFNILTEVTNIRLELDFRLQYPVSYTSTFLTLLETIAIIIGFFLSYTPLFPNPFKCNFNNHTNTNIRNF